MSKRIEDLLKQMPLAPPRRSLDERLLGPGRRRRLWWTAAVTAAAAGVLLVVLAGPWNRAPRDPGPVASPPSAERPAPETTRGEEVVSDIDYEGTFGSGDGPPVRAFRTRTLRNRWWANERTGTHVRVTEPHEQVIFVKASVD